MAIGAVVGETCTAMSPLKAFQSLGFNEGFKFAKSVISAETIMFTSQLFISPALWFDIGATAVTSLGGWATGLAVEYYSKIGGSR